MSSMRSEQWFDIQIIFLHQKDLHGLGTYDVTAHDVTIKHVTLRAF